MQDFHSTTDEYLHQVNEALELSEPERLLLGNLGWFTKTVSKHHILIRPAGKIPLRWQELSPGFHIVDSNHLLLLTPEGAYYTYLYNYFVKNSLLRYLKETKHATETYRLCEQPD